MSSELNKDGLKKCPHCGEREDIAIRKSHYHPVVPLSLEIQLEEEGVNDEEGEVFYFVECLPCDAQTGWCFDSDAPIEGFENGREMAIFKWNMRDGKI